ncbi:MAG TPA: DUF3343 domain-containing protein [Syntrophomonadaceae bacterium]|nr:DUF3343 domain-containing protein [Syntrophomonadaceae bacterium]HNX28976.1 DUF3343 domain-containing protein [Syntrophomonadaceae bacterium]HPR93732.1 DUF3343 domain-containing protein [Syntrophomonadaceae bacterium]
MKELFNINKYCIITFNSTSHALKAEKVMKQNKREILITPTLREVSSSCGLSLKFKPELLKIIYGELLENNVSVDKIYTVEKIDKKNIIREFEQPEM